MEKWMFDRLLLKIKPHVVQICSSVVLYSNDSLMPQYHQMNHIISDKRDTRIWLKSWASVFDLDQMNLKWKMYSDLLVRLPSATAYCMNTDLRSVAGGYCTSNVHPALQATKTHRDSLCTKAWDTESMNLGWFWEFWFGYLQFVSFVYKNEWKNKWQSFVMCLYSCIPAFRWFQHWRKRVWSRCDFVHDMFVIWLDGFECVRWIDWMIKDCLYGPSVSCNVHMGQIHSCDFDRFWQVLIASLSTRINFF